MNWEYRQERETGGTLLNEEAAWFMVDMKSVKRILKEYMKPGDICQCYNLYGEYVYSLTYEFIQQDWIYRV